jgi:hypothetical protein
VRVGTAQAIAADLRGSVGPIVDLRRGWLEIGLDGGFVVPGPRGRVSDRDPVRADGGWLGLGLTWAITPSRRRARPAAAEAGFGGVLFAGCRARTHRARGVVVRAPPIGR